MKRTAAKPWKPTAEQIAAADGGRVPDVIAPGLRVLFCGINPGLYSAAIRHHFGRPGNRFWPVLHAAGFTPRLLTPFEERELPPLGCGITNLFWAASARADEITGDDLERGAAPGTQGAALAAAFRRLPGRNRVSHGVAAAGCAGRKASGTIRRRGRLGAAQSQRLERALSIEGAGPAVPGIARDLRLTPISPQSDPRRGKCPTRPKNCCS